MKSVNVLIVDDDESIRKVLGVALSIEDGVGEVREASDGVDALKVCRDFEPDVVLLDYWMPTMDGAATAGYVRALHPSACIVAYSGVLESKPVWADEYYLKGDLPDIPHLLEAASE
jgi:chemotaxis response regulator CheB